MKSYNFVITTYLMLACFVTKAQDHRVQTIYGEAGGAGFVYSVNYDTRFQEKHNGWGMRVGVGYWKYGAMELKRLAVPAQINYLIGKKRHLLELAGGVTLLDSDGGGSVWGFTSNEGFSVMGNFGAGYRFQPLVKGLNIRVGATSAFGDGLPIVVPRGSIGFSF